MVLSNKLLGVHLLSFPVSGETFVKSTHSPKIGHFPATVPCVNVILPTRSLITMQDHFDYIWWRPRDIRYYSGCRLGIKSLICTERERERAWSIFPVESSSHAGEGGWSRTRSSATVPSFLDTFVEFQPYVEFEYDDLDTCSSGQEKKFTTVRNERASCAKVRLFQLVYTGVTQQPELAPFWTLTVEWLIIVILMQDSRRMQQVMKITAPKLVNDAAI